MAVGTGNTLSQLERSWFADKVSGLSGNTPFNEIKRRYLISQIGGASADVNSLNDLEKQWLRGVITGNGETPSDTRYLSTLWREAVVSAGLTASRSMNENKSTYFGNVA